MGLRTLRAVCRTGWHGWPESKTRACPREVPESQVEKGRDLSLCLPSVTADTACMLWECGEGRATSIDLCDGVKKAALHLQVPAGGQVFHGAQAGDL